MLVVNGLDLTCRVFQLLDAMSQPTMSQPRLLTPVVMILLQLVIVSCLMQGS